MTPCEVSFQQTIPRDHLSGVPKLLHQQSISRKSFYKRTQRMNSATEAIIDQCFINRMKHQEIDPDISNINQFDIDPDEEVETILRYLSFLRNNYGVESFVSFARSETRSAVEIDSINITRE